MFTIYFATAPGIKTITRKSNAIKVAERDGAVYVTNPAGEVIWGTKPAPVKAEKPVETEAKTKSGRKVPRAYVLDGHVTKRDEAVAVEVAVEVATAEDEFEMIDAGAVEVGDAIRGRRKRNPVQVVDDIKVGKKWITFYNDKGHAFAYVPVDSQVGRAI